MLESLLVLDAEAVLLIDHDDAEVLEPNIGAQEAVSPDDDVRAAVSKLFDHYLLPLRRLEAAESPYDDRKIRETVAERSRVLLRKNCRWYEHCHLPARLNRLERGAHGDLCFSVADVADEQPVHRPRALHVGFDVSRRRSLVGSVLEKK